MNKYFAFLIKKTLNSILLLFLLICIIFILLRISPGNPVHKFISPEFSPELSGQVFESFDLNSPVYVQFYKFIGNLLTLDFGISYIYRKPVMNVIMEFLPFTAILAIVVFVLQTVTSSGFALFAYMKKGSLYDKVLSKMSLAVYSVPTFVLAVILILFFSVWAGLLPSSGLTSHYGSEISLFDKISDYTLHMILPAATLTILGSSYFYKYIRDNLDSVSESQMVITLRSNGLSQRKILLKHILPNALSPLISISGIELGMLLSGALITETIFSLPGMGRLTVSAIIQRDYPMVVGCTFVSGFFIIFANILSDLLKAVVDKRTAKEIVN